MLSSYSQNGYSLSGGTNVYTPPFGDWTPQTTETAVAYPAPRASAISNLTVGITPAPGIASAGTQTVVQTRYATGTGGGPYTLAFSSNVTAGNTLFVAGYCNRSDISSTTLTDTVGTSWNKFATLNSGAAFIGLAPSSGANTVSMTCSPADSEFSLLIAEVSGASGGIDVFAAQRGAGSSALGVTTTVANDLILAVLMQDGGCTGTVTAPTVLDTGGNSAGQSSAWIAHIPSTSTGTPGLFTPSLTGCGNATSAYTVALKPGNANIITFTLRDNAASKSLSCSVMGNNTSCTDSTHSFTPAYGDLIDWLITNPSITAATNILISFTY
jgi:hypothetical protein